MSLGIEMLFASLGIDPKKLMSDFENLKVTIVNHLKEQNEKLKSIEEKIDRLMNEESPAPQKMLEEKSNGRNDGSRDTHHGSD